MLKNLGNNEKVTRFEGRKPPPKTIHNFKIRCDRDGDVFKG